MNREQALQYYKQACELGGNYEVAIREVCLSVWRRSGER